jgi:hypothetical protein
MSRIGIRIARARLLAAHSSALSHASRGTVSGNVASDLASRWNPSSDQRGARSRIRNPPRLIPHSALGSCDSHCDQISRANDRIRSSGAPQCCHEISSPYGSSLAWTGEVGSFSRNWLLERLESAYFRDFHRNPRVQRVHGL